MVPPAGMCNQHLLGEHRELHALVGIMASGRSMTGYIRNGLIDTGQLMQRHTALVTEMTRRGFKHSSPLYYTGPKLGAVDSEDSAAELRRRCTRCRGRL